jgi:hypothetical protein
VLSSPDSLLERGDPGGEYVEALIELGDFLGELLGGSLGKGRVLLDRREA